MITIIIALMIPSASMCREDFKEALEGWAHYVIPMPKKINIMGSVQVPVNKIWLSYAPSYIGSSHESISAMEEFFSKQTGVSVNISTPIAEGFEIHFLICNARDGVEGVTFAGCNRISSVPNSDQAYVIFFENSRLTIAALGPKGLHYGAMTLQQLIMPFLKKEKNVFIARLPIMSVFDWPDLAERGFWGHGYDTNDIKWFSENKLNVVELYVPKLIINMGIDKDGKGWVEMDQGLIDYAYQKGVKVVPIIFHIDQLHKGVYPGLKDMFDRYPEMKVRYYYKNISDYYPCGSSERFINVLSDWLLDLAKHPYINDISVWLSEWDKTGCACEQCRTLGRQRSEAKAVAIAWEFVRQKYSNKHLWLLPYNEYSGDILSIIPANSNIHVVEYNYSLKSVPIIPRALSDHSKKNEWIGIYPLFSGSSNSVFPSHMASLIRERMGEFVEKKVRKVSAYTGLSSQGLYNFNMAAAAEWSWNQTGRTTKEFAVAYGRKKKYLHPEKFAEWVSKIEPIEQRLRYIQLSSNWLNKDNQDSSGKNRILFGQGPLKSYGNYSQLYNDWIEIAECEVLAEDTGIKEIIYETSIIKGYLQFLLIYAQMDFELNHCTKAKVYAIRGEIDSALAGLLKVIRNYYEFVGNPEEKWFLRKSQSMYVENINQINQTLKIYISSQCNE